MARWFCATARSDIEEIAALFQNFATQQGTKSSRIVSVPNKSVLTKNSNDAVFMVPRRCSVK